MSFTIADAVVKVHVAESPKSTGSLTARRSSTAEQPEPESTNDLSPKGKAEPVKSQAAKVDLSPESERKRLKEQPTDTELLEFMLMHEGRSRAGLLAIYSAWLEEEAMRHALLSSNPATMFNDEELTQVDHSLVDGHSDKDEPKTNTGSSADAFLPLSREVENEERQSEPSEDAAGNESRILSNTDDSVSISSFLLANPTTSSPSKEEIESMEQPLPHPTESI